MDALTKLALIGTSVGVNIGDLLPEVPIRVGNKSLSEDEQKKLIEKAAQKRERKSKKIKSVYYKLGDK